MIVTEQFLRRNNGCGGTIAVVKLMRRGNGCGGAI